jgi:phosphopantetheinyl transferase
MSEVIVLHAARAGQGDAGWMQSLLERLPYAYRLELERRDAAARSVSLQGLGLLAEGIRRLREAAFDPACLRFPEGGKPFLEGGPQFSVSHSATRVAVALGECCELGFDVEDVGTHGRSRSEIERWTAVEATLKACGAGLRRAPEVCLRPDLATAELAGVVVHLRPVALSASCVATLATREPVGRVEVEERSGWRRRDPGSSEGVDSA